MDNNYYTPTIYCTFFVRIYMYMYMESYNSSVHVHVTTYNKQQTYPVEHCNVVLVAYGGGRTLHTCNLA